MTNRINGKVNNNNGKVLRFDRDHSFYVKRGDAKRTLNDPVNALSMYMEALERNPLDLDTRIAAAEILTNITHYEDSNNLIIPYMHLDEYFRKEAYCIAGFNFIGICEYNAAEDCFDRFFEMTDEVSERTDAIIDAMEYIDSLDEEPPLSDVGKTQLQSDIENAKQLFEKGDYSGSIEQFEAIILKHPNVMNIRYDLALAYFCNHNVDAGIVHLDKLLEYDKNNIQALCLKLVIAKSKQQEQEMNEICTKLQNCETTDPDDLLRLNGALLEAGRTEVALVYAKRLHHMIPYDCLANHRLALCNTAMSKYHIAAKYYEMLLRINRKDYIARYYLDQCRKGRSMATEVLDNKVLMLQYQLPITEIIERVERILKVRNKPKSEILDMWHNDEEFAASLEWALSLQEFSTSYTVLSMMNDFKDERVERCLREMIISPQLNSSLLNEALGILKRMGANEPYYTLVDGRFLEGRVNIVDMSSVRIPKNYRDIYVRFREKSSNTYDPELQAVASQLFERIIANSAEGFQTINEQQSIAMSAALELLACRRCGVEVEDDLLERYNVTMKRLLNAIDKVIDMAGPAQDSQSTDDSERNGE